MLVVALLTPERVAGRNGDSRLTTLSTEPQGAQLFFELARRLGWRVARGREPELRGDSTAIIAELDPVIPMRRSEAHAMLERVRRGGALLFVLGEESPLADSLHVGRGADGIALSTGANTGCPVSTAAFQPLWPDNRVHLYAARWRAPRPADAVTFVSLANADTNARRRDLVAAVGFPLGAGRVVVIADPDILRNDVLRSCEYGADLAVVRMLEYLRDDGPRPREQIVFDEYHQGYGAQAGTTRAIVGYLRNTRSGRVLLQLLAALLVLLAAYAPRVLAPVATTRVERRSPLEHVDALARAYAAVGATRTAASHLLHGVRRRFERGAVRGGVPGGARETDDTFLDRVQLHAPARAADVTLVRRALTAALPRREFLAAGAALDRIESSLTRT